MGLLDMGSCAIMLLSARGYELTIRGTRPDAGFLLYLGNI